MKPLKLAAYRVCKWVGLFAAARFATRRGLRILCYHGFTLADESDFRPGLFIDPDTFARRMAYLAAHGYPVLSLDEASRRLDSGTHPDAAVVITIDDGFYSVARRAWPTLQRFSFPATTYVTSYYVRHQAPIFRLAVQYLFWKTTRTELVTEGLGPALPPVVSLTSAADRDAAMFEIIRWGDERAGDADRQALAGRLAERLGLDYASLAATRSLSLMSADEIRACVASGMDIQLHTHRHRFDEEPALARGEVVENRAQLAPLAGAPLRHFCYPSGVWSTRHWPSLAATGVVTATTCDPGLNYPDTPRFGLRRFLDGEDISQIEFEAEVSGFSELLRQARSRLQAIGRQRTGALRPSSAAR